MKTDPTHIATRRIVLAGGSGFLGNALGSFFAPRGFEVVVLTRRADAAGPFREVQWDGETPGAWTRDLEHASAVINLAGRSVDCRYTRRNRREILHSRVASTRVLGTAIAACENPPAVWLNLSTATIYKHNYAAPWDESGEIGASDEAKDAFSIEVALAWEDELKRAATPRTRKAALRTAMVLGHARNSVFPVLSRLVRFGLGGRMGDGRQFVSWIHQLDFCRAVDWLIQHAELEGPVNICAPNPLTNAEMMCAMRRVHHVPVGLPAPAALLELGAFFLRTETELIIKSRRVYPRRLLESGFDFIYPTFPAAIQALSENGRTGMRAHTTISGRAGASMADQ